MLKIDGLRGYRYTGRLAREGESAGGLSIIKTSKIFTRSAISFNEQVAVAGDPLRRGERSGSFAVYETTKQSCERRETAR
jgi:hypothetical protein